MMNKKKFILFFIFLQSLIFLNAQKNSCKSSELEKYYQENQKKWRSYKFKPISKDSALKAPFSFITTNFLDNPAKSSDIIDSTEIKMAPYKYLMNADYSEKEDKKSKKKENKTSYMDGFEKYMNIEDSIRSIEAKKLIGPLSKPKVIKSEKRNNKWAILYYDFKYDELLTFGAGYWLAYSEDSGKNWKYNYTGLSERNNYIFKSNSKLPLWKDDQHIQIETDIVRMTDEMSHPLPPEYETVQDNALVIMDIREILKDSDGDGINDITEKKLFLNPDSADTDNDGIPDNKDTNPRFKKGVNEFTILYEGLMYGDYEVRGKGLFEEFDIDINNPKLYSNKSSDLEAMEEIFGTIKMIVTDDKNLQQIAPPTDTIIILTTEEYKKYEKQYKSKIINQNFSPLFKCDTKKETYILRESASYSGRTYEITRTKKGWKVKVVSSWIS